MLEKLQKIGFTRKEAAIYLALARMGESTANMLAKATSSNRTVAYNVLQQLLNKGLVGYVKRVGKRYYKIADPHALLASLRENERVAQDLIDEIDAIKHELPSNRNVEVFEGTAGMKIIHEELRNANDLKILNATGLIFKYNEYGAKHIVKDIEARGARVIANQSIKGTPFAGFKRIKTRYLPKTAENYATTFIFKDKLIIQVLKDKPFMIRIDNKEIYDGYRKLFGLLWNKL